MTQATSSTKACLECGGATHPIILLERTHGNRHGVLEYAAPDAKPGFFFGNFPTEGHVAAELCPSCGRITLRAIPKEPA